MQTAGQLSAEHANTDVTFTCWELHPSHTHTVANIHPSEASSHPTRHMEDGRSDSVILPTVHLCQLALSGN